MPTGNAATYQRLNYGVLFEQQQQLYLGQEYWSHTFQIPLPKKVYLHRELYCNNAPHCKYGKHVIKTLNALRTQTMANLNATVHDIHMLIPQSHLPRPKSFIGSSRSRSKRGIFDFVGQISKSLFGTATSDDIATLQRHMQTLNRNNAQIAHTMAIQEKHLSSFISTVDARFNNIVSAVKKNHQDTVALTDLLHSSVDTVEHEFILLEQLIMKQTNASAHLQQALDRVKLSIHELIKGKLSPYLITPQAITSSLHQIQSIMDKKYPQFTIIHKDPLYYFTYGDFLYARVHSTLFLTLKVPISPFKQPLLLYNIYSFPVPINSSTSHATKLINVPQYFAHTHDNQHFTMITSHQISKCFGTSMLFCSFHLALTSSASPSCISALFYNQKESVHSLCDFRFLTNEIKPNIVELSPSNTLMYQTPMVALDCPSGQRIIKGCPFCVMQLPCLCSVTSGTLFLPPRMGSCNNNSQSVTVLHPVNLALIQEFFDPKSHSTIFGDTTFQQYLDLKVPNFKIFNHSFSHFVAADQKQHLNLKKMAKLAQKDATVFQSLAESMLDGQIDFAVTSFPDTSGTIALIASALVLICMIYCIWSFFKIRKLTTIITLTQLPNSAKALPTPHPDLLSLYSNPSQTDNQVTTLQNVYTSFTSPWPYVTLSVLTTLLICFYLHKLWKKFKRTHKTTLHLEITTGTECMLFPITTLPLCPDNWNITPPQVINNIILRRTYLGWANFTINASDLTIQNKHTNTILNIPNTFRLSPLKALRLRRLLQQPYTAYYLLSHHQYYQLLQ